jgi:hypothetical protein
MRQPVDYPIPNAPMMPIAKAERLAGEKARRAFLYASVIFGVIGFGAGVAFGETITIGGIYVNGAAQFGTTVSIEPSGNPGELAVVTLTNEHVNDGRDNAEYFVGIDGLSVGVTFTWDADGFSGADRITVRPPEGITCLPADCSVTVLEGFVGSVVLLDWVGS